ncbi:nuclear transport factor 2 family protein [Ectopseudomonas mendocina]|uniref:Nuclear transport factor 2 family protein n=1 Tax=Ectopseudomonas mendocina TaxID=300 RepID=A0ABZ2RBP1_ECTME
MSTPERAIVEEMFAAFADQNLAAAVDTVSEDVVWIHHGSQKLPSVRFIGKNGVKQFFETNFSTLRTDYFRVKQLYQQGNVVIVIGEEKFTKLDGSDVLQQQWVQVYTVKDSLISRLEEFASSALPADYLDVQ